MDEFALIHQYFAGLSAPRSDVRLGIGDDCALLLPSADEQLAVSTDTLIAGRHFPLETAAYDIGWKAVAVNLSDLAAMGARPQWFTLALSLPEVAEPWLADFAAGLAACATAHDIALVGGDTTRGALSITITVMGSVPICERGFLRSGAKPGDLIAVTGSLGDAALALARLVARAEEQPQDKALRTRLDRPSPRCALALALRGLVHAAVDISDGLAGDLGHVLHASGVGALLRAEALPRSAAFVALATADRVLPLMLQGGDDYELCLCIAPEDIASAQGIAAAQGTALTVIGEIQPELGLRLEVEGRVQALSTTGYQHF